MPRCGVVAWHQKHESMRKFFAWAAIATGLVALSALVLLGKNAIEQQWWKALEPPPVVVATATTASLPFRTPVDVSVAVPTIGATVGAAPNPIATNRALATEVAERQSLQQTAQAGSNANATPQPPAPYARLEVSKPAMQSGSQVTGEPPLRVEFTVTIVDIPGELKCQSTNWNWGDGTADTGSCAANQDPSGRAVYSAGHTYERIGIHYPNFTIEFSNGSGLASSGQRIVVGAPMPPDTQGVALDLATWLLLASSLVMATAAVIALRRWGGRWRRPGYVAILLLLLGLVPPISYLPSPLGLFWMMCDCYSYDPRLPVRNAFVVAGRPEDQLRLGLNNLLGKTGLSPLHPGQPLRGYEFLSVKVRRPGWGAPDAFVTTRLTYQDGSRRDFDIPVLAEDVLLGAYRFAGSEYSHYYNPLNRLFTKHEQFSEAPFAMPGGPIGLSTPERLSLHPDAQRLDAGNIANWVHGFSGWDVRQRIVVSPQSSEFLVTDKYGYSDDRKDLWLVKLDGSPPRRVTDNVLFYAWSPDGANIIYNTAEQGLPMYAIGRSGENRRKLVQNGLAQRIAVTAEGAWYAENEALWVAPLDGSPPRKVGALEGGSAGVQVLPSPDGRRVAYACGPWVCMRDADGSHETRAAAQPGEMAWNSDGSRLAVASSAPDTDVYRLSRPVGMSILDRQGNLVIRASLAPNGPTGTPQWTPDGRYVFVQTAPHVGRRIVAIETATGLSLDLTRPRWDPWFTLTPDGKYVIMANGRGDFWRSEVRVRSQTK